MTEITCRKCGDTDGPWDEQPDGTYLCEGCLKGGTQ